MRKQSTIAALMFAAISCMMVANPGMPSKKKDKKAQVDSTAVAVGDSVFVDSLGNEIISTETDTTQMDSLQKAIWKHNKVVDDSIRLDSINRKKSGGIDAPVQYQADDSLVYDAHHKVAHLYGNSNVKYENMDLTSDRISMDLDKSNVRASGTKDSMAEGGIKGKPVFKMGNDTYDTDTIKFNFKSKKALINNVYTEQQDGFLTGMKSKRDSSGVIYLQHGRYTTCDDPHPDFYISLSRAKVRPARMSSSAPPISWSAMCRCRWVSHTDSSRSPRATAAVSSCLPMVMRATVVSISVMVDIISPSATSGI